jgi:N-sulfoglucosamine sulfohydrolase
MIDPSAYQLKRYKGNPILSPKKGSEVTTNPAAWYDEARGVVQLRYSLQLRTKLAVALLLIGVATHLVAGPPNVLLITVDDMNADSVGAFGCPIRDTTPQLDQLAEEGMRFEHAHVQAPNCSPSRNVLQTGRYPQNNGVEGFYDIVVDFPILPDLLKAQGYRTGIWGKVADSTPTSDYPWDAVMQSTGAKGSQKDAAAVYQLTKKFISESLQKEQAFYFVLNISDPHHPLFNSPASTKKGYDDYLPSKIFGPDEVVVPGFLPDITAIRKEVTNYYNSVRRADDIAGAALQALDDCAQRENTIVMFLSDHGMPFPFAKTNLYRHSTRTPWIVRIPGITAPGSVDSEHMISAIDFMPTLLELCGIEEPPGVDGRSFAALLKGESQTGRDQVFKEFHENAGGVRNPMRAVETRRYGYIFNPWSDGERLFKSATLYSLTYKAMKAAARDSAAVDARVQHFNHRVIEEFYDYENDPDALHNLIDNPQYAAEIEELRTSLQVWMEQMEDPALDAFLHRDQADVLKHFMQQQDAESADRLASGGTRKRK